MGKEKIAKNAQDSEKPLAISRPGEWVSSETFENLYPKNYEEELKEIIIRYMHVMDEDPLPLDLIEYLAEEKLFFIHDIKKILLKLLAENILFLDWQGRLRVRAEHI